MYIRDVRWLSAPIKVRKQNVIEWNNRKKKTPKKAKSFKTGNLWPFWYREGIFPSGQQKENYRHNNVVACTQDIRQKGLKGYIAWAASSPLNKRTYGRMDIPATAIRKPFMANTTDEVVSNDFYIKMQIFLNEKNNNNRNTPMDGWMHACKQASWQVRKVPHHMDTMMIVWVQTFFGCFEISPQYKY